MIVPFDLVVPTKKKTMEGPAGNGGARRGPAGSRLLNRAALNVRFPLHYATLIGDAERVRYLLGVAAPGTKNSLRRGPNLRSDDEDDLGRTALHVAAAFGHTEICNIFLDLDKGLIHHRADGMQGVYPLHVACAGGWERDSFLNDEEFYGSLEGANKMADPNFVEQDDVLAGVTNLGSAASHFEAARAGTSGQDSELTENKKRRLAIVTLLLERGADATARTATGTSALHLAAGCGDLECARKLVEYGDVLFLVLGLTLISFVFF